LEIKLPEQFTEEGFWEAVTKAEAMIDKFLQAPEVPAIPEIDPASLDALPWKARDGSPAKEGAWGWLHGPASYTGPDQGTADLIKALEAIEARGEKKLTIGNYDYSFTKERAFIQRRPLKKGV